MITRADMDNNHTRCHALRLNSPMVPSQRLRLMAMVTWARLCMTGFLAGPSVARVWRESSNCGGSCMCLCFGHLGIAGMRPRSSVQVVSLNNFVDNEGNYVPMRVEINSWVNLMPGRLEGTRRMLQSMVVRPWRGLIKQRCLVLEWAQAWGWFLQCKSSTPIWGVNSISIQILQFRTLHETVSFNPVQIDFRFWFSLLRIWVWK